MTSTLSSIPYSYISSPAILNSSTASTAPFRQPTFPRSLRKSSGFGPGIVTASTPNLNALYSSQSRGPSVSALSRKPSLASLTPSSLASIPDVSETYAFDAVLSEPSRTMAPVTPGKLAADDVAIGDTVDVPGNMFGTVRFIGTVQGKKGTFAGVELHTDFAPRGKNSGDVDGVSYFTTTVPGAGIFLPVSKAQRRESPPTSASSFPLTPTNGAPSGLKAGTQNSTNFTPPTPSFPKFGQSVNGPGRAASPQGKKPRTSLPRPDSPVRRLQMTPASRPSMASPAKVTGRYVSPTANRFAQSVRGTAGDPSKKLAVSGTGRKVSVGPRSASAMGSTTGFDDDDTTPTALQRTKTNGSVGSVSSFNLKMRPPSRANDDEVDRLRGQLAERDRQLRDQASTLAEMESSLVEVQTLMEHSDGPRLRRSSLDDKDSGQLRAILREKNEKIAMLTTEFDAHRADFRSTIDALEMASTETVRVYESQKKDLQQEVQELVSRLDDVDSVARQLKQLEELVQELEEGLEDARRGEAEARGEVEFLRGEVERTRSELRRERERASAGAGPNGEAPAASRDLEQKEDEIRGLKAIIHSLSRDSAPGDSPKPGVPRSNSYSKVHNKTESLDARITREGLERELGELRDALDRKSNREEELERELERFRRGSASNQRASAMTVGSARRSSLRDSRDTVILARNHEPRSPELGHKRGMTLDTMPESDAYSTATETSTLWCEICETGGHDILTCTNMFGPEGGKTSGDAAKAGNDTPREAPKHPTPMTLAPTNGYEDIKPAPLSPIKTRAPVGPPSVRILPNPMESGPVAGKESGVVDVMKWCALCERDGHASVDCPFEDAF